MDEAVICYGIERFIENIFSIILFLIFGIIVGKESETGISILSFGLLRKQAGGIHCKTYWGCKISMFSVILLSVAMSEFAYIVIPLKEILFLMIISIVFLYAPTIGKTVKITDEKIFRRKKGYSLWLVTTFYVLSFFLEATVESALIVALFIATCSLVPNKIRENYEKDKNENCTNSASASKGACTANRR